MPNPTGLLRRYAPRNDGYLMGCLHFKSYLPCLKFSVSRAAHSSNETRQIPKYSG